MHDNFTQTKVSNIKCLSKIFQALLVQKLLLSSLVISSVNSYRKLSKHIFNPAARDRSFADFITSHAYCMMLHVWVYFSPQADIYFPLYKEQTVNKWISCRFNENILQENNLISFLIVCEERSTKRFFGSFSFFVGCYC